MTEPRVDGFLVWWVRQACRHAHLTVLAGVLSAGLSGYYAATHLSMNSDTGSMISDRLAWRRSFLAYEQSFPQLGDEIQIVINGASPEAAEVAQRDLAKALRKRPDLFENVFLPGAGAFLDRNGLLYRDPDELEELGRNVEQYRDVLLDLGGVPTIRSLVSLLQPSLQNPDPDSLSSDNGSLDVRPVLVLIGKAFQAQQLRGTYQISWREVFKGRPANREEKRRFIVLNPRLDYTQPLPAGPALRGIREAVAVLRPSWRHRARVRISGSEAIEHEALESAIISTRRAGIAALLAILIILWFGLRSVRLLIAAIITLMAGLSATAGFAAAAVGSLNLISIAFAILYIGLGIDYAVHLCLGYAEALAEENQHEAALLVAAHRVGRSLLFSAVTTAACFYAFIPTDFIGVSELGLISGSGMIISLFVTLTLLPALLSLDPLRINTGATVVKLFVPRTRPFSLAMHGFVRRRRKAILVTTAVAASMSLAVLPRARFDQNPMNLGDPNSESLTTYRRLLNDPETVPLAVSALVPNADRARELAARLRRLEAVESVLTSEDLVPQEQSRKLEILATISRSLGSIQEPTVLDRQASGGVDSTVQAVKDLRGSLAILRSQVTRENRIALSRLSSLLQSWLRWLSEWPPDMQESLAEQLEESLVGTAPLTLKTLRISLEAHAFDFADLPENLQNRWISPAGAHRVQVIPRERLDTSEKLAHFVEAVRGEAPGLTGIPVNDLESGRIAVSAFKRAFALAALASTLVLLVLLRRADQTAMILGTLLVAALLTFGASVAMDLPMNFANLITLPLILGVGVDNGIHVIHRARLALPGDKSLYATSTARAVLFSTLTTMASFGILAISRNQGLASMGQLLTIGMLALLLCTLLVLPTLLAVHES